MPAPMPTAPLLGTAFASDFDGTLAQSNWETGETFIDPATLDAIRRYREAGGLFGICTGRELDSVASELEGILDLDFYIVVTGAQVLDRNRRPLFEKTLCASTVQGIYEQFVSPDAPSAPGAPDTPSAHDSPTSPKSLMVAATEHGFMCVGKPLMPQIRTVRTPDELHGKVFGVSLECLDDVDLARELCQYVLDLYGHEVDAFQNVGSVDIVPRGCSKGSGVDVVREALGLQCVVGIGDSYNDLPLLDAGDVSYTFAASPEEVRNAADHVVENLAEALDHFISSASPAPTPNSSPANVQVNPA